MAPFLYLYFLSTLVEEPRRYHFGSENLKKTLQPSSSLHADFFAFLAISSLNFFALWRITRTLYISFPRLWDCAKPSEFKFYVFRRLHKLSFSSGGFVPPSEFKNFPVFGRFSFQGIILATQTFFPPSYPEDLTFFPRRATSSQPLFFSSFSFIKG